MTKPIPALNNKPTHHQQGFALPLVIVVGLFMMIGGFTLMARTFGAFRGSIKNNQQIQAQELAERGVSRMLDQLNTKYRYLWVNCYQSEDGNCMQSNIGGWGKANNSSTPQVNLAHCLNRDNINTEGIDQSIYLENYTKGITLEEKISPNAAGSQPETGKGLWRLESYTLHGNPWTGGRGTLRVSGERTNTEGDETIASAVIEHHVQVKAKPCDTKVTETFTASSFPGLLAESIDLGNNDVLGQPSGNVICTKCTDDSTMTKNNSIVDGDISIGSVDLPKVPTFPSHLSSANIIQGSINIANRESAIIIPPDTPFTPFNPEYPNDKSNNKKDNNPKGKMCITDENLVAHCRIDTMTIAGDLIIKTRFGANGETSRPVRLYLETENGKKPILDIKGGRIMNGRTSTQKNGTIVSLNDGKATNLGIFGKQTCLNQEISITGQGYIKGFIFAPCGEVGINGGGGNSPTCQNYKKDSPFGDPYEYKDQETPVGDITRDCTGGDIEGAVWAKEWDKAAGTKAEITVPRDISDELVTQFGEDFLLGPSDFVGVGVPRWTSYQN